jgi:antitoxin (DNA-binding transcriptional repressor) of toxin-antitoxin stability system
MAVMTISEARTALPEVLNRVAEGEEITITRHGRPIAVVVRPDIVWHQSGSDVVMLDANVLLAATDEGRAEHGDALTILNEWAASGTALRTSGQILREYLAVATRPAEHSGLGLRPADAVTNVRAIRERTALLAEDARVADRLHGLLADVECNGKQVHDANVIAAMLAHGVGTVVTMNVADFARYVSLVEL